MSARARGTIVKKHKLTSCIIGALTMSAGISVAHGEEADADLKKELETLQKRIEKLEKEAPRVSPDRSKVEIEISGRINQAILYADNGDEDQAFIVDNDNSGSRFGVEAKTEARGIELGANLELGVEVNTTDEISFGDDSIVGDEAGESDFLDLRHAEIFAGDEDDYGMVWLGFGDIASESVSEFDLSGTGCCIAESDVDDIAGGLEFETGQEVDSFFSNLDGFRTSRIGYDSRRVNGLQFRVAGRQEDETIEPDVSLNYERKTDVYVTESGVGWRPESDEANDTDLEDSDTFHGSISVSQSKKVEDKKKPEGFRYEPDGFNATLAGGVEVFEDDDVDIDEEYFLFGKLGWRGTLNDHGETRFSVDGFYGEDITNDFGVDDGNLDNPVEAYSLGAGVVQALSGFNTEVYLGGRVYWVDLPGSAGVDDPDELYAIFTGARVRF